MSRPNRILVEMCRSNYPQPEDIIAYVLEHPTAARSRDWYGLLPIQYLAMNHHLKGPELVMILEKAPLIKAEYE
jgi:hypothetical protein